MKKIILILLMTPGFLFSQCIVGDCENGVGTYVFEDGSINDGSWKNGQLHGIGIEIMYDEGVLIGTYDGEFEDGVMSGWGTLTLYDEEGYLLGSYVGYWKNNDWNGWGIWISRDKTIEKGIYKDGELIN